MTGKSDPEPLLDPIEASDVARERVRIVLLTLAGHWRVKDAMARLEISRTRFQTLRRRMLEGAMAALEPRPAGRPPRPPVAEDPEVVALRRRVTDLTKQLQVVRTHLALSEGGAAEAVRRRVREVAARRAGRTG